MDKPIILAEDCDQRSLILSHFEGKMDKI